MARGASVPPALHAPGVISLLEIYSIDEVKSRMRWTDSSLRAARRSGLKLMVCGKRRYVSGTEIARFLARKSS